MEFLFFLGKFVTKDRAFGNNTSFLQQFFSVSGGGVSPSPLATPLTLSDDGFFEQIVIKLISQVYHDRELVIVLKH